MKEKREKRWLLAPAFFFICFAANSYLLVLRQLILLPVFLLAVAAGNLLPFGACGAAPSLRLRICRHGSDCLKLFAGSVVVSTAIHILLAIQLIPDDWSQWVFSLAVCICVESILFWNGIISVYCTSVQLGIRERVLGVVCGWIPIAQLVMLFRIIRITSTEVKFETAKHRFNEQRASRRICATKYPILLVHGVFFRDSRYLNYWGRIPAELERNGAQVFYGEHQSAASVCDSAEELTQRVEKIIADTGCEKVNIIAHSKGGLDCRWAICQGRMAPYAASLTTINTPHRGCEFAEYLLNKLPQEVQRKLSDTYNATLKKLGDYNPDFMAAVTDLTVEKCVEREKATPLPENIYVHSVGSRLNKASSGKFPLNFTYHLVKYFDGDNDGLVGEQSFQWGEDYTFLTIQGKRGISHGDMVDLNRENIPGFDVREFYVQLTADLKHRGL